MKDPYVELIEEAFKVWRIDSIKAFERFHKTGARDPVDRCMLSDYSYAFELYGGKAGADIDGEAVMNRYKAEAKARIASGQKGPRNRSAFLPPKPRARRIT